MLTAFITNATDPHVIVWEDPVQIANGYLANAARGNAPGATTGIAQGGEALRLKVAQDLKLVEQAWRPLWVVDFPMFEYDEESRRWAAMHHPFTSPKNLDAGLLQSDPGGAIAQAYDMVLNGSEIGGGSMRIYRQELQSAVFGMLGIDAAEAKLKFGFLLDALRFGAPPHGGIAFGVDRIAMLMSGAESIRDVIAFPKTQTAACLLTEAPTEVSEQQLRELHIRVRTPPAAG